MWPTLGREGRIWICILHNAEQCTKYRYHEQQIMKYMETSELSFKFAKISRSQDTPYHHTYNIQKHSTSNTVNIAEPVVSIRHAEYQVCFHTCIHTCSTFYSVCTVDTYRHSWRLLFSFSSSTSQMRRLCTKDADCITNSIDQTSKNDVDESRLFRPHAQCLID